MKTVLLTFLLGTGYMSAAQIRHTLSPESSVFYRQALQYVKPEIMNFIEKKTEQLSSSKINADSLLSALKKEPELKKLNNENLKTISLLILIQCSYKIDKELKEKVLQMSKQESEEMNYDKAAPFLERKNQIAKQVSEWLGEIEDYTVVFKNLM